MRLASLRSVRLRCHLLRVAGPQEEDEADEVYLDENDGSEAALGLQDLGGGGFPEASRGEVPVRSGQAAEKISSSDPPTFPQQIFPDLVVNLPQVSE